MNMQIIKDFELTIRKCCANVINGSLTIIAEDLLDLRKDIEIIISRMSFEVVL